MVASKPAACAAAIPARAPSAKHSAMPKAPFAAPAERSRCQERSGRKASIASS
jgi:hypothetical protein